jgi:hypothetical protein
MKINHFLRAMMMLMCLHLASCENVADLVSARMQWEATGHKDYTITVRHIQSVWHSQDITITVNDGFISHSATCTPAPTENGVCNVESYDPGDYTVEGLFSIATDLFSRMDAEDISVTFDKDFGYPTSIRYDNPAMIDEDQAWIVLSLIPMVKK